MIFILRGGGDIASGVAIRLHRAGFKVIITELPEPLAVRRTVAFSEAVYWGETTVEDVKARLVESPDQCNTVLEQGDIPVLIDPNALSLEAIKPAVLIDGRMKKRAPDIGIDAALLVIGLGPGFIAGKNCHAVIETNRGHSLGRVIWSGEPQTDTGVPRGVANRHAERVLRSPMDGVLKSFAEIGDSLEKDQVIGEVNGQQVLAPFQGVLRGLLPSGIRVSKGLKIGDVDPRSISRYCYMVSDKSLAVGGGGGVLEAILSQSDLRSGLRG